MDFDLSPDELAIQSLARDFARQKIAPVAQEYDERAEFPRAIVEAAREIELMNLAMPVENGGGGLGTMAVVLVSEELAWGCAGIALAILLNELVALPIVLGASQEQKDRYLRRLAEGIGSYALTEPDAGSDVAAINSRAERTPDGYRISGHKIFISNAPEASFFVVFAKTDRQAGMWGISAFFVDRDLPGVKVLPALRKMGQRADPTAEVVFSDVLVPPDALIGAEGEGMKLAMRVFERSRPMVAAFAVGVAQRALDEATAYANRREAFGHRIIDHEGVGFKLADMSMRIEAARLLTRKAAWRIDAGLPAALDSAHAKAFAADTAMWATTEAVQVFGGYGYSREFPVEKLMRDAKVLQIYEGTSEIQRMIIVHQLREGRALQSHSPSTRFATRSANGGAPSGT